MVVCHFYLQGRCKFGADCRYEHPTDDNYKSAEVRIAKDFEAAEKGGQWPFSCYALSKDAPIITRLVDTSPEELRSYFYNSKKEERMNDYFAHVANLHKQATEARASVMGSYFNKKTSDVPQPTNYCTGNGNVMHGSRAISSFKFAVDTANKGSIFSGTSTSLGANIFSNGVLPSQQSVTYGGTVLTNQSSTSSGTFSSSQHNFISSQPSSDSIFSSGVPQVPSQNVFQSSNAPVKLQADNEYLKIDDLTEEEKAAYFAPMFSFGKIPLNPPPKSLC